MRMYEIAACKSFGSEALGGGGGGKMRLYVRVRGCENFNFGLGLGPVVSGDVGWLVCPQ